MRRMRPRALECLTTPSSPRKEISTVNLAGYRTSTSKTQRIIISYIQHIESTLTAPRTIRISLTTHHWPTRSSSARMLHKVQWLVSLIPTEVTHPINPLSASNLLTLPRCIDEVEPLKPTEISREACMPPPSYSRRIGQIVTPLIQRWRKQSLKALRFHSFVRKSTQWSFPRLIMVPLWANTSAITSKQQQLRLSALAQSNCRELPVRNKVGTTISSLFQSIILKCILLWEFHSSKYDTSFIIWVCSIHSLAFPLRIIKLNT